MKKSLQKLFLLATLVFGSIFCILNSSIAYAIPESLAPYDFNGDGMISPEEAAIAAAALQAPENSQNSSNTSTEEGTTTEGTTTSSTRLSDEAKKQIDLNGDGMISPEEMAIANKLYTVDENGNLVPIGGGSSNETPAELPRLSDEAKKQIDLNGDGMISPEEMAIANKLYTVDENGNLVPIKDPNEEVKFDAPISSDVVNACQDATTALSWVICTSFQTGGGLVDDIYGAIEEILIVKPIATDSNSTIYQVWKKVCEITNVIFVIFIIIVIYSQLTGLGINNYGVKRVLPRIIISVVLVNLSFFICALSVDISNVIGSSIAGFLNNIQNSISGESTIAILSQVNWGALAGYLTGGAAIAGIALIYAGGIKAVFWTVVVALIGVIISVMIGIITIGLRQGVVAILIMIAPLAFICYLLPNTEKWFEKWKNTFFQMLFFYPMFSFLFGASKLAGWAVMQGAVNVDTMEADAFQVIIGLAIQVMPLFLAISLMKMSSTILGKISSGLEKATAPFRASVGAWGASHAEQKRQQYIRDAHWYNGGRLRAYLQKRQKLRELDTAVNAGHNVDRATEYALTKQASSLKRDASGHALWRGRPNSYTRAAKRADLQRIRAGVAQQNLANTLSEYKDIFKDRASQRLAAAGTEAFKDTMMQQFWAENIAQGDQTLLLNEYLKATKNRRRSPYEFNRLVHDAAGSMGHIGQATIMGQVIKRSAEIETKRRTEAAIMINKFNVSKSAFRGMTFDTAFMNDDGYEEDGNGNIIEDIHYNIKPGFEHQEWQHYIAVHKETNKEISRAKYDSLSEEEQKQYRKVRYMEIKDDDNDSVQYVYEDDAGYMKEMLNNDIMIGDPINRRYAMSFGLPRFDDQQTSITTQFKEDLGRLRKYHSTVSAALNNAHYAEHDAAFTAMLTSQINSGYITSASQLNIARLNSLRLTAKTGKIVQNDPIILEEYAKLLNCLNSNVEGERFEDFFTDEAIANYRDVNGVRLHGLRLGINSESGKIEWQRVDRLSADLTLEDQKNFIKHELIPKTAKKLMGAFKRNLSPTALDNLKPEGVDKIKLMIDNIEQLEATNRDPSVEFVNRTNPKIKIFENADPGEIKDRITSAQNRFYGISSGGNGGGNNSGGYNDGYTDGYSQSSNHTGTAPLNERMENGGNYFNATAERVNLIRAINNIFDNYRFTRNMRSICNDLRALVDSNDVLRNHRDRAYEIIELYSQESNPSNTRAAINQSTSSRANQETVDKLKYEFTTFVETLPELNT